MKARWKLIAPTAALSIAVLTAGGALAESTGGNEMEDQADVQLMTTAKVSLTDAIRAAETAKNAKAVSAALEGDNGKAVYEVELMLADGKSIHVGIDGSNGQLLQALPGDHDGDNGNEEGGEED